MSLRYDRLRAPRSSPAILIEPSPPELSASLTARPPAGVGVQMLGRPVSEWRDDLRRRLNLGGPLVVSGHQAEFFHAGVFAKNIAASLLAARHGGAAIFVVVDSDTPKSAALHVPVSSEGELRRGRVDVPASDPRTPVEFQHAAPDAWSAFFQRLVQAAAGLPDATLLNEFSAAWLSAPARRSGAGLSLADGICAAVPLMERALDLTPSRPVRVSELCDTSAFRAFAAHLMLNSLDFAGCYNAAQSAYRRRHRVRNRQRPVPPLAVDDGAVETPFWVIRATGEHLRQRLFVRTRGARLELLADQAPIRAFSRAELADPAWHASHWATETDGWHIRPRALALSCFMRLVLSDLFIHGIGGAKYDEVTDDFALAFFGAPLAPYACVTATLHVSLTTLHVAPTKVAPRTPADVLDPSGAELRRRAAHLRRDLLWNPQRHLVSIPRALLEARATAVERGRALAKTEPANRPARRAVHQEIGRVNHEIHSATAEERARLEAEILQLEEQAALSDIVRDREYFFGLHSRASLTTLTSMLRSGLS